MHGSESLLSYSRLYVGGVGGLGSTLTHNGVELSSSNGYSNGGRSLEDPPGFVGAMQQLVVNGRRLFRLANSGQLSNHALNAVSRTRTPMGTWGKV